MCVCVCVCVCVCLCLGVFLFFVVGKSNLCMHSPVCMAFSAHGVLGCVCVCLCACVCVPLYIHKLMSETILCSAQLTEEQVAAVERSLHCPIVLQMGWHVERCRL